MKSRQGGDDGIGVGQTGSLVSRLRQTREAGSTRQDRARSALREPDVRSKSVAALPSESRANRSVLGLSLVDDR